VAVSAKKVPVLWAKSAVRHFKIKKNEIGRSGHGVPLHPAISDC
jgi:hypothetical protein